jgi:hypothetical protein
VSKIWVLRDVRDDLFSPRKPNTNARSLLLAAAESHIEVLLATAAGRKPRLLDLAKPKPIKALPKVAAKKDTA